MIRDLRFPDDARQVIDSLREGLEYDAAISLLGLSCAKLGPVGDVPDFATGIRCGGVAADSAVRRDAPGLLARFSLISMVSRIERHAQLLLLQRRILEELGVTGQKMQPQGLWKILRRVNSESRGGPVKLCSELVVVRPSPQLRDRMTWLEGVVNVRNCLAHRLGLVSLEDVKPNGAPLEETKDTDTLKVVWLRLKASIDGEEITAFPHHGGGQLECGFVEYQREWRVGDQIEVTAAECQAIAFSLSLLGTQLLGEFEAELYQRLTGPAPL